MSSATPNPWGPLPQSDRGDELQRLSLRALQQRLPVERFLYRDERTEDRGVDSSIEALLDRRCTNFRGQVQVKGTDVEGTNRDNSVSLPIETRNFNYLLNGPAPLYVLWIAPRDELRFLWAHDERRRFDRDNPGWMRQQTVTLRFVRLLDASALVEIHERILREGRLHRQTRESLARAASVEPLAIAIDPTTLGVTDPEAAHAMIVQQGTALIAAGQGRRVIDQARLLATADREQPRVQLIYAYAQFSIGRYLLSAGHLGEALLREHDLTPRDRHFLRALQNACAFQTGRISAEDFQARERDLAESAPPELAWQHHLEVTRFAHVRERDAERSAALVRQLRVLVEEGQRSGAPAPLCLQARLVLLSAEGLESIRRWLHEITLSLIREESGRGFDGADAATRHFEESVSCWEAEAEKMEAEARQLAHPWLTAEAVVARTSLRAAVCADTWFVAATVRQTPVELPRDQIAAWQVEVEQARRVCQETGFLEAEIRAVLLLADLHDLAGERDQARCLAESMLGPAEAMGYARLEQLARDHLSGQTEWRQLVALAERAPALDNDAMMAQASDDDIRRFAALCLQSLGLPQARLPVVERDCRAGRAIASEKMSWCRHLELVQDRTHAAHPATHYARDPNRACMCLLHGHQTAVQTPDWEALISAFRQTRCAGCPDRSPRDGGTAALGMGQAEEKERHA